MPITAARGSNACNSQSIACDAGKGIDRVLTLRTLGARARAALLLMALVTIAISPAQALAVSSGGWNNIGHGPTATSNALNGKVETFTNVGTTLYVGGDFTDAGGIAAADHIAKWNGTSWSALGGGLGDAASAVYAIAVDTTTGKVFAAGSFQNAGGDANADRIAVFSAGSWASLSGVALGGTGFALAIIGRTLYVGGSFADVNGIPQADAVAAYGIDSGAWSAITDGSGDIGGTVAAMVPDGAGGLYVGGSFIDANAIPNADFIAHWTGGTSWSAVGATAALNNRVRAVAMSGSNLYVGGDFTNANGDAAADKVAHWNGSAWSALGASSFFGDGGNSIYALVADDGTVVAAGYFNNGGGLAKADGIAAFVGSTWKNVGTNAAGTDGPVSLNTTMLALRVAGAKLYLGGLDSSIGDGSMNAFGAWYRIHQPDGQIKTPTTSFAGNNIYNATGASQTRLLTIHRGNTGTFSLMIQNDGLAPEAMPVKGPGSGGGFTATYLDGATNVTAQVVAGTYSTGSLGAGASKTLTLKVKVGTGVAVGASRSWLVVATSSAAGTAKDSVKATVKAS